MLNALLTAPSRILHAFSPGAMPALSRTNYAWELRATTMMPAALACLEGNVVGVIAEKAFNAPNLVIATISAAPPLSLLTSMYWTRFMHGRDRVRATILLQCGLLACVGAIALAPFNNFGIAMLVAFQLLGRACMAGIFTARSDIWRANYPRTDRARATGKLTIVSTIVVVATAALAGTIMDIPAIGADGYRYVYGLAIVAAAIGVWCFSHVRWRGRAAHLKHEARHLARGNQRPAPRDMLRVLRSDTSYRRYMIAMFVMGAPNLAAMPVFIVSLEDAFPGLGYAQSLTLTQVLPFGVPILMIPLWTRLMDRVHIIRFRVYHSWFFVTANALMGIGVLTHSLPVLYGARALLGAAFAGGMLAWQLGHHDFARREIAHIYMGIHVTLTGVRGAVAPFVGTILYSGLALSTAEIDLSIPALGGWTFILLSALGAAGALLFLRLYLDTRRTIAAEPRRD